MVPEFGNSIFGLAGISCLVSYRAPLPHGASTICFDRMDILSDESRLDGLIYAFQEHEDPNLHLSIIEQVFFQDCLHSSALESPRPTSAGIRYCKGNRQLEYVTFRFYRTRLTMTTSVNLVNRRL